MNRFAIRVLPWASGIAALALITATLSWAPTASGGQPFHWKTVVNNGDLIPGATINFNSYNQPSVNRAGLVVFRARSKGNDSGGGGETAAAATAGPIHGIFQRDMAKKSRPIVMLADRTTVVPQPNNMEATFNEFPSFPRIAYAAKMIGTRANSTPVWEYSTDGGVTLTRAGTAAIECKRDLRSPLETAMQVLGAVPGFEYFQVPGASTTAIKFDVFPGAPAVTDRYLVFKGNYTDNGVSQTGVFFRDMAKKGNPPVTLIANNNTLIPGTSVKFGSTAPPSAKGNKMVFLGLDNEEAPTLGGIYRAPLKSNPPLTELVALNSPVPGVEGATINKLGEGLSYSGRYVGFWAAWGTDTRTVHLVCRTEGNKDLKAYCDANYPDGYNVQVPLNQGIFVYDSQKHKSTMVARTGGASEDNFLDFTYWVFSGRPPLTGGGEPEGYEPPRWRTSSFVAVGDSAVAFKGTKSDGTDGIYVSRISKPNIASHLVALDTTMPGNVVDPEAPAGVMVTAVGIERDGFRGRTLALNASMANADATVTWGGIYLSTNTTP